jgi:hypothetical protein
MKQSQVLMLVVIVVVAASGGCDDEDERVARIAQTANQQQAEQNAAIAENTRVVAEGSKRLVEAESQSRQEMIALQRDLRSDQAELGRQRDALEKDRQQQEASRRRDSLLAPAIVTLGLLIACIAPLIVAGFALVGLYIEPTHEESEVVLTQLWLELRQPASDASPQVAHEEASSLPLLAEAER